MPHYQPVVAALAIGVFTYVGRLEPTFAQSTVQPLQLSLADALARAVNDAPEVTASKYDSRTARARRIGAGIVLPINPRLSVDLRPPVTGGAGYRDTGYGAVLDVLFQPGGAPAARVREADHEAAVADADLVIEQAGARLRAFAAYVKAQVAELRIEDARHAIDISKRVLSAVERRVAVGAAAELDHASAELDLALIQASEASAVRMRDAHLMELRDTLDLAAATALDLTSRMEEPPTLREPAYYVESAQHRHPVLVALQSRIGLLESTEARLEKEVFPRVGLYGGVDAAPLSPIFGIVGLTLELPIAQRNQGPRAVTARTIEATHARLEIEARRLGREVVGWWNAYEGRRLELARLTETALPASDRAMAFAQAGWEAGRFDLFRLLTAARDVLRLRATRLDVLEAAWLARIELERAVGGPVS